MGMLLRNIKRALPEPVVRSLIRLRHRANLAFLRVLNRSGLCRRLYLAFAYDVFDREMRAVIAGHLRFEANQQGDEAINYFLRRATHRLEKGLIMRPQRSIFALDYIEDTVAAYASSLAADGDPDELSWAHDVLTQYFDTVGEHAVIDSARQRFTALPEASSNADSLRRPGANRAPFRPSGEDPAVEYGALKSLSMERRSVRWYQDRKVPREIIDRAVEVAVQSPSACNRQPYKFLVFDDKDTLARVSDLPMGVAGFNHNFPAMAAVVGNMRAFPHPRDRHLIYIDGALAAMAFMFALQAQGVASCSINWPDIPERERRAAKILELDPDERIVMFISLGYADPEGLIPYSQKLSLDEAREFVTVNRSTP